MTGHRALEKKEITQGKNRKVQNPSESLKEGPCMSPFLSLFYLFSMPVEESAFASQSQINFQQFSYFLKKTYFCRIQTMQI